MGETPKPPARPVPFPIRPAPVPDPPPALPFSRGRRYGSEAMSFFTVVLLALLQGVTEALPVSRSGHGLVARLWLDGSAAGGLEAVLHLATALGLAVVVRGRLAGALGE